MLKVKGWKIYMVLSVTNLNKTGLVILIINKVDLRKKKIIRDKDGH